MASIVGSLGRAARAASSLLLARAQFAALELTQSGVGALRWLVAAFIATALLMLTLAGLTATLVLALWDHLGWYSLAVMTLGYAVLTVFGFIRVLRDLQNVPPLLEQTFAELAKDREALLAQRPDAGPENAP